jgi:hypothetical protein
LLVAFGGSTEKDFGEYCLNVKGLVLQGCEMGLGGLVINSKVPEAYDIETVKMGYVPIKEETKFGDAKTQFPLYASASREKVVCELRCATMDQKEKLFISGICFYLE